MAYKFQRGDFTASGSINVEDALTGSGTVTLGTSATDLVEVVGNASFDNNVTLGDATSDIITVSGQLTASHGAKFAKNIPVFFGDADTAAKIKGDGSQNLNLMGATLISNAASFAPESSAGMTLGTTSAELGHIYIADDKKIQFGNGQDATIEYDEDGTDELRFAGAAATFEQAVSFDANVTLGNAQADVIDIDGQVTASHGMKIADTMGVLFAGDGVLDFSNATTNSSYVSLGDNLSNAFFFANGADTPLKFTTTDNLESATFGYTVTGSVFSGSSVGAFVGDGSGLTNLSLDDASLTRGYVWIGDSDGDAAAVDAKTSGQILIGDGTDLNSVAVSGDVTISTAGAVTIANNAVETTMIKNNAVTMASMATGSVETAALASGSVTRPKIGADAVGPEQMLLFDDALVPTTTHFLIADGTDYSSFALSGDVTCTNAGVVTIAAGAVENSMLANDYMIIGGTTVDLGDTITALTALTDLDLTAASHTIFDTVGANALTIGATTTEVIIAGDLVVKGTTHTISASELEVNDAHIRLAASSSASELKTAIGLNGGVSIQFGTASAQNPANQAGSAPFEIELISSSAGGADIRNSPGYFGGAGFALYRSGSVFSDEDANGSRQLAKLQIDVISSSAGANFLNGISSSVGLDIGKGRINFNAITQESSIHGVSFDTDGIVLDSGQSFATDGDEIQISDGDGIVSTIVTTLSAVTQLSGALELGSGIRYGGTTVLQQGANQVLTTTSSYVVVSGSSATTIKLPAAPGNGQWYGVKRSNNMTSNVKINYNSGAHIDGDEEIVLETAGAAVTLVYDGTTDIWNVF
jgi:hypothetical protein